jgi:hypothetical protein
MHLSQGTEDEVVTRKHSQIQRSKTVPVRWELKRIMPCPDNKIEIWNHRVDLRSEGVIIIDQELNPATALCLKVYVCPSTRSRKSTN